MAIFCFASPKEDDLCLLKIIIPQPKYLQVLGVVLNICP